MPKVNKTIRRTIRKDRHSEPHTPEAGHGQAASVTRTPEAGHGETAPVDHAQEAGHGQASSEPSHHVRYSARRTPRPEQPTPAPPRTAAPEHADPVGTSIVPEPEHMEDRPAERREPVWQPLRQHRHVAPNLLQRPDPSPLSDIDAVDRIVKDAAKFLMNAPMRIVEKGNKNFVTDIDIEIQEFISGELGRMYPNIPMFSEERQNAAGPSASTWILDPVDGTTNLAHDYDHSCVSLAYMECGVVEYGIIVDPFDGVTYRARRGHGMSIHTDSGKTTDGIRTSGIVDVDKALIGVGMSPYDPQELDLSFNEAKRAMQYCQDIRRAGSAALELAFVASGREDVFFERALCPWDYAAGMLLIREAGGAVCEYDGKGPFVRSGKQMIVAAATAQLLEEVRTKVLMQPARRQRQHA